MKNYAQIIQTLLPLLKTIQEGIEHIQKQLEEPKYEEAFNMLQDVLVGIIEVEEALQQIESNFEQLNMSDVKQAKQSLVHHFNEAVTRYENKNYNELEKAINQILDAFCRWQELIRQILLTKL